MVVSYKLERGRNIYAFNEYYTGYYTDQRRLKKIQAINATIRMHTFGNLKMYKIDSAVIMILR